VNQLTKNGKMDVGKWVKIFGILVILLFISLFTFSLVYKPKLQTALVVKEKNIVFINKGVLEKLNELYKENYPNEFLICLNGEIGENYYKITSLSETLVYNFSEYSVYFRKCPSGSIGSIHSHTKPAICIPSAMDIYTFGATGEAIFGIICGENKIAFFDPTSLTQSLKVVIS